jgi:hypothetical protein
MTLIEIAECLTARKYKGKEIDLPTAKDSLAKIIPMLEIGLREDLIVLNALREAKEDYKDWREHCEYTQSLIKKGKHILTLLTPY